MLEDYSFLNEDPDVTAELDDKDINSLQKTADTIENNDEINDPEETEGEVTSTISDPPAEDTSDDTADASAASLDEDFLMEMDDDLEEVKTTTVKIDKKTDEEKKEDPTPNVTDEDVKKEDAISGSGIQNKCSVTGQNLGEEFLDEEFLMEEPEEQAPQQEDAKANKTVKKEEGEEQAPQQEEGEEQQPQQEDAKDTKDYDFDDDLDDDDIDNLT